MYSKQTINEMLKKDFRFKKRLGQNFILDQNTVKKIAKAAHIEKSDTIIEVGAGIGALTTQLAPLAKKVICFEIDQKLAPYLEENTLKYKNITIIYEDYLNYPLNQLGNNMIMVANLPYSVTSPILFKLAKEDISVAKALIMVQKEIGDRLAAQVGTKEYNALTVIMNYYFTIEKKFKVSRQIFYPIPEVESVVIELKRSRKETSEAEQFCRFVNDAFRQKRKTLKNNLKNYDLATIESVLLTQNLNLQKRAEEVPLAVFEKIVGRLYK